MIDLATPLLGPVDLTAAQIEAYFRGGAYDEATVTRFARALLNATGMAGLRTSIVAGQIAHETARFKFGGQVPAGAYNLQDRQCRLPRQRDRRVAVEVVVNQADLPVAAIVDHGDSPVAARVDETAASCSQRLEVIAPAGDKRHGADDRELQPGCLPLDPRHADMAVAVEIAAQEVSQHLPGQIRPWLSERLPGHDAVPFQRIGDGRPPEGNPRVLLVDGDGVLRAEIGLEAGQVRGILAAEGQREGRTSRAPAGNAAIRSDEPQPIGFGLAVDHVEECAVVDVERACAGLAAGTAWARSTRPMVRFETPNRSPSSSIVQRPER